MTAVENRDTPISSKTATKAADDRSVYMAEGPAGSTVPLSVPHVVPAQLLNGDEIVLFAIKPSPWFVLIVSFRWVVSGVLLGYVADMEFVPSSCRGYLYQAVVWVTIARLVFAMLEWVSRQYVLTNRRVMRLSGVFEVDLFESSLSRIQSTTATFTLLERILRVGTISFETAGAAGITGGGARWRNVSRPMEVHQKLLEAIRRSQNRGGNGV